MSDSKTFYLPDLGEGLPDATIVEWVVKVGDIIKLDEPLVSMETAKAVVDVPSPFSGKVTKLYGENGDVIETGHALVDIALDASLPQRADAEDTGHSHGGPPAAKAAPAEPEKPAPKTEANAEASADAGTVVGAMQ
ncbi:MAG: biotin/lipoyl-containing protein, partial [Dokdonella sp.]